MGNTNFQTIFQMQSIVNSVVKQATGREAVQNIDMDYVTVAQQKKTGENTTDYAGMASFLNNNELPLKVLAKITAVQSGEGDPAPDNVRPITGWTGANVQRTGKNLLPSINETQTINGITWTKNADGSVTLDGTATANSVYDFGRGSLTLKAGTYTAKELSSDDIVVTVFHIVNGSASVLVSGSRKFTLSQTESVFLRYFVASGKTVSKTIYPQIELGSTATAYEPYSGTTIPVSWETEAGTVYGGTLNVTTGVLTVDRVCESRSLSELTSVTDLGDNLRMKFTFEHSPKYTLTDAQNDLLCNIIGQYSQSYGGDSIHMYIASAEYAWVYLPENIDLSTVIQLSFSLATPFTVQLTPTEIDSLIGENNLYADTGDVSVSYTTYYPII